MSNDHSRRTSSIWARPEPGARSPSHTRDGIVRAAIRIADAEGFDALSMRRVAAELGAGTMTLYHYVRTKDELLALVDNAITGELLIPAEELPAGWRAGMSEIAHRTRDAFVRHPWVGDLPRNVNDRPNGALHIEQSLSVMAETGLEYPECLELILLVDDYVLGYVHRFNPVAGVVGDDPDRLVDEYGDEIARRLAELDADTFPHLRGLFADSDPRAALVRLIQLGLDPGRFDRGLELLLDGIERRVEDARPDPAGPAPPAKI